VEFAKNPTPSPSSSIVATAIRSSTKHLDLWEDFGVENGMRL